MARPLLIQELIFNTATGAATASGDVAYVPASLLGQYKEFSIYVEFSTGSAAGKIQIESAYPSQGTVYDGMYPLVVGSYGGTWAAEGNTIDWAVETSQKVAHVTAVMALIRVRCTTTPTSGTIKCYFVAFQES